MMRIGWVPLVCALLLVSACHRNTSTSVANDGTAISPDAAADESMSDNAVTNEAR